MLFEHPTRLCNNDSQGTISGGAVAIPTNNIFSQQINTRGNGPTVRNVHVDCGAAVPAKITADGMTPEEIPVLCIFLLVPRYRVVPSPLHAGENPDGPSNHTRSPAMLDVFHL
jgi:hypothetical protein